MHTNAEKRKEAWSYGEALQLVYRPGVDLTTRPAQSLSVFRTLGQTIGVVSPEEGETEV